MKKLPILTALIVLSVIAARMAGAWQTENPATSSNSTSSEKEPVPSTENAEAVNLLNEARSRLFETTSLKATLIQRATFGKYNFKSEGTYLAGPNYKYRLETSAQLGDMEGRFLEVSDGQVIHTRRQVGKTANTAEGLTTAPQIELSRRDVQAILRAAQQKLDVPKAMLAAEVGIGGLPSVLASLQRSMIFDAVRKDELDGHPVTVIQGRWREDRKEELAKSLGTLGAQIAAFMPDMVRVAFDDETLIPRRFTYLKLASEERKTYRPILTVDLVDIQLNVPLPSQAFTYVSPPGVEERDETEAFLQAMNGTSASEADAEPPATTD